MLDPSSLHAQFVLQTRQGVGPLDGFGSAIVDSREVQERSNEAVHMRKMIGLEELALQPTFRMSNCFIHSIFGKEARASPG